MPPFIFYIISLVMLAGAMIDARTTVLEKYVYRARIRVEKAALLSLLLSSLTIFLLVIR